MITKVLQEYGGAIELEPVEITSKSAGLTQWDNEGLLSRSDAEKVARFWPHRQHTG
ncbi:hypothetical protein KBC03_00955 [Patescibacteria group bacterium]|nr:hypothetical protein [Patescibacteria group bacterium]